MGTVRANQNDQRSRYAHQAYDLTYGRISPERGVLGVKSLAAGTYDATFELAIPGAAGTYSFNLPPHLYGTQYSIIKAAGAGTVTVTKADNGGGAVTLLNALTDVSALAYRQGLDNDYPHSGDFEGQEQIDVVVAGTPTSDFVIALHLSIAQSGWK